MVLPVNSNEESIYTSDTELLGTIEETYMGSVVSKRFIKACTARALGFGFELH